MCLKWLIVSLMVHQLSMVIATDCQEVMRNVFSFFSRLKKKQKKTEITLFAFVVWGDALNGMPVKLVQL